MDGPLILIPQHFGALVFDRRNSRYLPFDHAATELLDALIEQPIGALVDRFAARAGGMEGLRRFVETFEDRGFLTVAGRFAGQRLPLTPPDDHLAGPLAVHLEVIGACNLACKHCFAGALPRNQHPLTVPEMDLLFAELASMGSFRLGLTGGEPMMRADLFDILDAAVERGLHPCLTTNGLFINEENARKLGARDFVWLNLSLDGATAATNDAIRGHGVFDEVVRRAKLLRRHARFTLAFTITSHNAHEVEACAMLARDLGAHTAVFRPLYPTGTALEHRELMPSYEQYADALDQLERMTGLAVGHEVCGIDPFSPQMRAETEAKIVSHPGCGAGTLIASISVQGEVNPCSFMGAEHNAGNIREHGFRAIWDRAHEFQSLRAPSTACSEGGCFEGGCRARAKAATGSVHRADPWQRAWESRIAGRHPKDNLELVGVAP